MTDPQPGPSIVELVRSSPNLRKRLSKPRFRSPELNILLLEANYHLVGELRRALESWGHRVWGVPVSGTADEMLRRTLSALAEHRPDCVVSVNHLGFDAEGALGEVFTALEVPVAAWYVDSPLFVLRGQAMPAKDISIVYTWERSLVPLLKRECDARYLPLAADPTVFSGEPGPAVHERIAFVGNSGLAAQAKWKGRIHPDDEPTVLRLERVVEDRRSGVLDDPEVRTSTRHADRLAAATWRANSRLRARFLERFSPDEVVVLGDEGWARLLPDTLAVPGPAYGGALAHAYRAYPVHLNITSLQMPTAVNQRVFDGPAAGGFVLSDAQDDVRSLFAEDELVIWSTFEEAVDKARYYLRRPEPRIALARRAQARVLAEHTYRHRAATIVEDLRARFGPSRSQPQAS